MRHDRMHKRGPQDAAALPSSIVPTSLDVAATTTATDIVSASAPSGFTTLTSTVTQILPGTAATDFSTQTTVQEYTITNSAQYASLISTSAEVSTQTTKASVAHSSSASATATSAVTHKSTPSIMTLIPAIVAPVAAVLILSFVAFWLVMRRRHQKEVKNQPDFVMTEDHTSRGNSHESDSSTRNLVLGEKKALPPILTDFAPAHTNYAPPKYSMDEIGVARPLTPQDADARFAQHSPSLSSRPTTRDGQYRNFSGPRPGAQRPYAAPDSSQQPSRKRSRSHPDPRGPLPGPQHGRDSPFQSGPDPAYRGVYPRVGPSPTPRDGYQRGGPSPYGTRPGTAPGPRNRRGPSPTTMDHTARALPPAPLNLADLTGAFNGASAISQYSPIVKNAPSFPFPNVGEKVNPHGPQRDPVPASSPVKMPCPVHHGSQSPRPSGSPRTPLSATVPPASSTAGSTEDSLQLAKSSIRGFHHPNTYNNRQLPPTPLTITVTSPPTGNGPEPSPRLPPPATRSRPPQPHRHAKPLASRTQAQRDADAQGYPASIISPPDTDDEYEDADVDADGRSDVSSLHEERGERAHQGRHDRHHEGRQERALEREDEQQDERWNFTHDQSQRF